jgi:hypothetical protein
MVGMGEDVFEKASENESEDVVNVVFEVFFEEFSDNFMQVRSLLYRGPFIEFCHVLEDKVLNKIMPKSGILLLKMILGAKFKNPLHNKNKVHMLKMQDLQLL